MSLPKCQALSRQNQWTPHENRAAPYPDPKPLQLSGSIGSSLTLTLICMGRSLFVFLPGE